MIFVLVGWFGTVFVFQPFGQRAWALAVVSTLLAWLLAGLRRKPGRAADTPCAFLRIGSRALLPERIVLACALACWLGFILWSAFSQGARMPTALANPAAIRVVTWNILLGQERGWPWNRHGWPVRKAALKAALDATRPDVLCVQEALDGQVAFLAEALPGHRRVGVGRDDGRSGGEYCAIFFEGERFEETSSGTFWLEQPVDRPPERLFLGPKRICTWVRLRDRRSGRFFRVYNTHNYLTDQAQVDAARLILAQVETGDPTDAVLLAGDFNATASAASRRLFAESGLAPSAIRAGKPAETSTYQFYGIRLKSLDEILVNRGWRSPRPSRARREAREHVSLRPLCGDRRLAA